jgi:hypothetical protein
LPSGKSTQAAPTTIRYHVTLATWLQLLRPDQPMVPEEVVGECGSAMLHSYGESMSAGKHLLADAHKVAGLPVNIVRAGQIGGPMNATLFTWPRQGWLYSIIQSSKKLGAFPKDVQAWNWTLLSKVSPTVSRAHLCQKPSGSSLWYT